MGLLHPMRIPVSLPSRTETPQLDRLWGCSQNRSTQKHVCKRSRRTQSPCTFVPCPHVHVSTPRGNPAGGARGQEQQHPLDRHHVKRPSRAPRLRGGGRRALRFHQPPSASAGSGEDLAEQDTPCSCFLLKIRSRFHHGQHGSSGAGRDGDAEPTPGGEEPFPDPVLAEQGSHSPCARWNCLYFPCAMTCVHVCQCASAPFQ